MNSIALEKENEVLDYLTVDNLPSDMTEDTPYCRAEQQKGLEVFRKTMNMQTVRCMQDAEFFKFYQNSFSRCRSLFDEPDRVSLTSKKRTS